MLRSTPPPSLDETGLLTNPVHVIDLAFVLPAHVLAGVWLWRQRRVGATGAAPVTAAMFVVTIATGLVLARVLRASAKMSARGV